MQKYDCELIFLKTIFCKYNCFYANNTGQYELDLI